MHSKKLLRLGALDVTLTDWWRTILAYFLKNKKTRCVVTRRTSARCFQVNSLVWQAYFCFCDWIPLCQVGSATGNQFGSLLASRFRRPTWRNVYTWVMILPESSAWRIFPRWYRVLVTKIKPTGQPDAPTWELFGPQGTASFWERTEAPFPPKT